MRETASHPPGFPKVLYSFPDCAGQRFTPSNGTEGMVFTGAFCERCQHEKFTHTQNEKDAKCEIFTASMIGDDVPQWVYSGEGWPICKAWKYWNWEGENGEALNLPPEPEPNDPRQLWLPFAVAELFGMDDPEILVTKTAIFERDLVGSAAARP
jgi:hypothetical protein